MNNQPSPPAYFDVMRALQKGGLSLWLNRRSLLPMLFLPVIATFITQTLMQSGTFGESPSLFLLALINLPSDFIIGLLCSLVIVIIMNAPKKDDRSGPMMFSLNIIEKRSVMIKAAIVHAVIGYLSAGLAVSMFSMYEIMVIEAEKNIARTDLFFLMIGLTVCTLYGLRLFLLPIFVVADIDARLFYAEHKNFGISFPIFFVSLLIFLGVFIAALFPLSIILSFNQAEQSSMMISMMIDVGRSLITVIISVWNYASLSVGLRQMIDRKEGS